MLFISIVALLLATPTFRSYCYVHGWTSSPLRRKIIRRTATSTSSSSVPAAFLPLSSYSSYSSTTSLHARRKKYDTNKPPPNNNDIDGGDDTAASSSVGGGGDGETGTGRNWIERSFPVTSNEESKIDPKAIDDYNLGICGDSFQTGPLSKRMFDAIRSKSSIPESAWRDDPDIVKAFRLYAADFTAKEAVRAALDQNGLQLALSDDEQDIDMWGDVDTIRLLDPRTNEPLPQIYDTWEDCIDEGKWEPGQGFDFVVRQVPAKMRELTLDELLSALDPQGELRQEAKEKGMSLLDEPTASLQSIANENVRRTEASPRGPSSSNDDDHGDLSKRGYQPLCANRLLPDSTSSSSTAKVVDQATLIHVMDGFVTHGCLLVDLYDPNDPKGSYERMKCMSKMWDVVETFFNEIVPKSSSSKLPPLSTIEDETGSRHAKIGYASYDNDNMQFLETRWERATKKLLPPNVLLDDDGEGDADDKQQHRVESLRNAYDLVASIAKSLTKIAVAASSIESGAFDEDAEAFHSAQLLSEELFDDGNPLPSTSNVEHSEGTVTMSPHRLCRYSNNNVGNRRNATSSSKIREVFGAHTDSTFITAVPVASVPGLEVYDEDTSEWYSPERLAKRHSESNPIAKGDGDDASIHDLPWHARYVVFMAGELLQICTRNEILATVHRVVAVEGSGNSRLSAPILLRGRPGTTMNVSRYLGRILQDDSLLNECNDMTVEAIHDKMQPTSFQ